MSLQEQLDEEYRKQRAAIEKPNLVIVGKTGAGKSSLIKSVFALDDVSIGTGEPCTEGMKKYNPQKVPLVVYDTEGYELSSDGEINNSNFKTNVQAKINEMNKGTLIEHVHLVWYCISIAEHRVTDYDIENMRYFLSNNMKLAVIFTQCDLDEEETDGSGKTANEFKKVLKEKLRDIPCFETCASRLADLPLDVEKIIEWSCDALPTDQLKQSFIASQKCSIPAKRKIAYGIMAAAATAAAATGGFNPLPVSDSILIVPQQMAMAASISKVFGFDSLGENIGTLLKSQLISIGGKQLATSLLKLIPGLGQAINAAVAGTLTAGLGIALIEIYSNAYAEFLEKGKIPNWAELFTGDAFAEAVKRGMETWKNK